MTLNDTTIPFRGFTLFSRTSQNEIAYMNNNILFIDVQKDKFTKSFTSIPLARIRLKISCAAVI
jgi:hypothetical protein